MFTGARGVHSGECVAAGGICGHPPVATADFGGRRCRFATAVRSRFRQRRWRRAGTDAQCARGGGPASRERCVGVATPDGAELRYVSPPACCSLNLHMPELRHRFALSSSQNGDAALDSSRRADILRTHAPPPGPPPYRCPRPASGSGAFVHGRTLRVARRSVANGPSHCNDGRGLLFFDGLVPQCMEAIDRDGPA